jgi:hypothetical protein
MGQEAGFFGFFRRRTNAFDGIDEAGQFHAPL